MPPVAIRRLGVGDAERYRAIRLAALMTAPEAFGSTYEAEAAWPLGAFAERLAGSVVFGAEAGERLVGMAGLGRASGAKGRREGFVWGLYVEPDARGRGMGAALLDAAIAAARGTFERLTLTVARGNEPALALYRRFGFAIHGVPPRWPRNPGGYLDEPGADGNGADEMAMALGL